MGPCPFRHGYRRARPADEKNRTSFNGAMPFQAWILPSGIDRLHTSKRFNGAMPFQAWILPLCAPVLPLVVRFNGAMPFQAWILRGYIVKQCKTLVLQWGHALSGMDTTVAGRNGTSGETSLQWGHALSGMDTVPQYGLNAAILELQWGHALSGMDMCHSHANPENQSSCFNGAMPFQAWIRRRNVRAARSCVCFNGAMPFQTWIFQNGSAPPQPRHHCFNGARPFQAWIWMLLKYNPSTTYRFFKMRVLPRNHSSSRSGHDP